MDTLFGIVIVVILVVILVKLLGSVRNVGRSIIGKPSVQMEKAQKFIHEKMKDNYILKSDFNKLVDLTSKALGDTQKAVSFLRDQLAKGNIQVVELPERYSMPSGSSKDAVLTKVTSIVKDFNLDYFLAHNKFNDANTTMYRFTLLMTLFALDDLSTVDQAKELVNSHISQIISDYSKKK